MSYFIENLELTAFIGVIICMIAFIFINVSDAVDYYYSKKRGEI